MESQTNQIKEHLEKGKSITQLDALKLFGCLRLSGRIWELRHELNMPIKTIWESSLYRKRYARYSL